LATDVHRGVNRYSVIFEEEEEKRRKNPFKHKRNVTSDRKQKNWYINNLIDKRIEKQDFGWWICPELETATSLLITPEEEVEEIQNRIKHEIKSTFQPDVLFVPPLSIAEEYRRKKQEEYDEEGPSPNSKASKRSWDSMTPKARAQRVKKIGRGVRKSTKKRTKKRKRRNSHYDTVLYTHRKLKQD
jgi:hypothetical protein